jgi:hypothetical protein
MWPEGEVTAFLLVTKLFNQMKDQPKFKELGLTMNKTETTNRKEVELLQRMEQKIIQDGETVPLNHKKYEDKIKTVEFAVPTYLLMPDHKKIAIELMDEILF